jgi:ubiquinol-cytochrome c reductase iron-sulfur subunit
VTPEPELLVLTEHVPAPGVGNTVVIALAGLVAALGAAAFAAALLVGWPVEVQGLGLAAAFLGLAVAVRRHFAATYPELKAVEERHAPAPRPDPEPLTPVRPVARRTFLSRMLLGVGGLLGISLLVPLASLGDPRRGVMSVTGWREGVRLVDTDGNPLRPEDVVAPGQAAVWPEDAPRNEISSVIVVRLDREPEEPTNLDWVVDNLVAYSKICTHTGCPVGMLRAGDNELYCPCHQAQFDALRAATPTFGPAARPLPQLPLGIDADGYLVALGDFQQPVGPAVG